MRAIFILKNSMTPERLLRQSSKVAALCSHLNLSSYGFGNHERVLKKNRTFPFWDCAFSQLKASHSGGICLQPGSINGNDKKMFFPQTENAGFSSFRVFRSRPIGSHERLSAQPMMLFGFNMTCIELPHHQAAWLSWVAGNRNATQNPCPAANNARAGASLK